MTYLPSLYKARGVPVKSPICAICLDRTRGRTLERQLTHGVRIWLCEGHHSVAFMRRNAGRDFVVTLTRSWRSQRMSHAGSRPRSRRTPRRHPRDGRRHASCSTGLLCLATAPAGSRGMLRARRSRARHHRPPARAPCPRPRHRPEPPHHAPVVRTGPLAAIPGAPCDAASLTARPPAASVPAVEPVPQRLALRDELGGRSRWSVCSASAMALRAARRFASRTAVWSPASGST